MESANHAKILKLQAEHFMKAEKEKGPAGESWSGTGGMAAV